MNNYLAAKDAAQILGVTVGTLTQWRHAGRGPDFVKPGRAVLYPESRLHQWIESRIISVEQEAQSEAVNDVA